MSRLRRPSRRRGCPNGCSFADVRARYALLKASWGGTSAYDRWFATAVNNAGLAGVGLYVDHVPEFTALIEADHHDLARFYQDVKMLAALPKSRRMTRLAALTHRVMVAGNRAASPPLFATGRNPGRLAP